jgi:hypothetical protein
VSVSLDDVASARKLVLSALLLYVGWQLATSALLYHEQFKRERQQQEQTVQLLELTTQRQLAMLQQQKQIRDRQQAEMDAAQSNANKHFDRKMPASAVVRRLRQVNVFGLVASPERLLHCADTRGAWDYTCIFHGDPMTSANWVEFGVLVDDAHIIEMSERYPSGYPLPLPLSSAAK